LYFSLDLTEMAKALQDFTEDLKSMLELLLQVHHFVHEKSSNIGLNGSIQRKSMVNFILGLYLKTTDNL